MKICGVYKITSPTNRIYVGSSVNVISRWRRYKNLNCAQQIRLYNSLKKYGVKSHKFEIICECSESELFAMEQTYGLLYNVLDDHVGLNCRLPKLGDSRILVSSETRKRMGKNLRGNTPWNKGIPLTDEVKQKLSNSLKGKIPWNKGKTFSEESKKKMSESTKGQKSWNKGVRNGVPTHNSKIVLCLENGIYYESTTQAAVAFNYVKSTLQAKLNGQNPNNINLIYV